MSISAQRSFDAGEPGATVVPGQLRVIKRNGQVVPYTDDKIAVAMTKAFWPLKAALQRPPAGCTKPWKNSPSRSAPPSAAEEPPVVRDIPHLRNEREKAPFLRQF